MKVVPRKITPKADLRYRSDVRILNKIKMCKEIIRSTGESFETTCSPNQNGLTNKQKRSY